MSVELLSNDRRAVDFGSSQLGLRDASIRDEGTGVCVCVCVEGGGGGQWEC